MRFLQIEESNYDNLVKHLASSGHREAAEILTTFKAALPIVESEGTETLSPITETQRKIIADMEGGGSLRSLRWQGEVHVCMCFHDQYYSVSEADATALLRHGIIVGVPQDLFPDKEYIIDKSARVS